MTLLPTQVRFCHQTWSLTAQVVLCQPTDQHLAVVTDVTPFHPVSHIWPDHPADRGTLTINQHAYQVQDCQVGAVELASGELYIGQAIPVKRDSEGWSFVVVHLLVSDAQVSAGDAVELDVDKAYQQSLSRGHSAGHIAYLALNKVLTEQGYWRKDADRKDPLGHYDFNSYAQEQSLVTPDQCFDHYRLGKTLRKRGLNSADMLANLMDIEQAVNAQLQVWLAQGTKVTMRLEGEALTDSRYWQCDLGEATPIVLPCGGTHVEHVEELRAMHVLLRMRDEQNLEMITKTV